MCAITTRLRCELARRNCLSQSIYRISMEYDNDNGVSCGAWNDRDDIDPSALH